MKISNLVSMISFTVVLSACSQSLLGGPGADSGNAPPAAPPAKAENGSPSAGSEDPEAGPNFQIIKSQILETSCNRCHSDAGGNRGGVNLETYATVLQNIRDVEFAVSEGTMPPRRPLDPMMKELLLKWIQMGAPQ